MAKNHFCWGSEEMAMYFVVDFGRLTWPVLVTSISQPNQVGRLTLTPREGDRGAV